MTGKLTILDHTGHTEVAWSRDMQETVDAANEQFQRMLDQGYTAFEMDGPKTGSQLTEFAPAAREILLIPRMVGG